MGKLLDALRLTAAKDWLLRKLLCALLWLDIKVFVLLTMGNCRPGETISAASWSLRLDGKWQGRVAVPAIDWLALQMGDGPGHCQRAYNWQIKIYQPT